jgi:hypothetical protein
MKKLDPDNIGTESLRLQLGGTTAANRVLGTPGQKYPTSKSPNYAVEGAVEQLVRNQNELIDRVAALEAQPSVPFPGGS